MATYLVTGGAGFIGSHIATALVGRGDRVRILDNLSSGKRENLAHLPEGGFELIEGDLRDAEAVAAACAGVEGIFHEAAQVSVPRSIDAPADSYAINVMGTLNVLEGAVKAGARKVVFAASSAAYGDSEVLPKHEGMTPDPLSPYASGKLAAERMLAVWGKVHGLETVALRYFNIFGPRQADDSPYTGVIALFAKSLLEGKAVTIHGDGEQSRDFTYVDNAVQANLLAMETPLPVGTVLNVGTGERISVNQLHDAMAELCGFEGQPERKESRAGDVRHSLACLERIRAALGYEPAVGWREGLATTVAWYRDARAASLPPRSR